MRAIKNQKLSAEAPKEKITTTDPELAARFNRVLEETVTALEEAGIQYVFIGGIASHGLGRPRSTHDIDVFVRPEDAEVALRALEKSGFSTEKTDMNWLYKAFKERILVDVIFKSKGDIYLDSEMYKRMITAEFHGRMLRLVAPEDLVIIKAAAHGELTPGHWHDALALLSHATIDWHYLLKRAKRAPRRLLSLLLYAQSTDIWVPNAVIHELYETVFGNTAAPLPPSPEERVLPAQTIGPVVLQTQRLGPAGRPAPSPGASNVSYIAPGQSNPGVYATYATAHLREALAQDSRTNEMDIQIEFSEGKLLLRGEVNSKERRDAVLQIASEVFKNCVIENQIRIADFARPTEWEEVK